MAIFGSRTQQAMPERDVVVVAFSHSELDQAVAARQLDFVLTGRACRLQPGGRCVAGVAASRRSR